MSEIFLNGYIKFSLLVHAINWKIYQVSAYIINILYTFVVGVFLCMYKFLPLFESYHLLQNHYFDSYIRRAV